MNLSVWRALHLWLICLFFTFDVSRQEVRSGETTTALIQMTENYVERHWDARHHLAHVVCWSGVNAESKFCLADGWGDLMAARSSSSSSSCS